MLRGEQFPAAKMRVRDMRGRCNFCAVRAFRPTEILH
jgi:hypothetical protein